MWKFLDDMDSSIDCIKDRDVTYAYQMYPLDKVKEKVSQQSTQSNATTGTDDIGRDARRLKWLAKERETEGTLTNGVVKENIEGEKEKSKDEKMNPTQFKSESDRV